MTKLALIVATTKEGDIGYNNTIPWRLEGDLKRFKELTLDNAVIMGSNTYKSLGKEDGLPGRLNIVVGKTYIINNNPDKMDRIVFVTDIESALKVAYGAACDKVFFIGGKDIYKTAFRLCEEAYITVVHKTAEKYDTRLSELDVSEWALTDDPITVYCHDPVTSLKIPSHTYLHYEKLP